MTTLIKTGGALGNHRCDARCHDGKNQNCDCICGGKNHGVGVIKAMENTEQICRQIMDERAAKSKSPERYFRNNRITLKYRSKRRPKLGGFDNVPMPLTYVNGRGELL